MDEPLLVIGIFIMELWREIKVGYEVSSLGRIKSLSKKIAGRNGFRITKEKILKQKTTTTGYLSIQMGKECKGVLVHRVFATAFIENPLNKPQVNHINGIKNDNRIENLEWVTQSENQIHAYSTGLQKISYHARAKGERAAMSKLKESEVLFIRENYFPRGSGFFAKKYNVSRECIVNIIKRKTWKHVGK